MEKLSSSLWTYGIPVENGWVRDDGPFPRYSSEWISVVPGWSNNSNARMDRMDYCVELVDDDCCCYFPRRSCAGWWTMMSFGVTLAGCAVEPYWNLAVRPAQLREIVKMGNEECRVEYELN